eukprot:352855-Pelagomonas_calceolata.AAC.2
MTAEGWALLPRLRCSECAADSARSMSRLPFLRVCSSACGGVNELCRHVTAHAPILSAMLQGRKKHVAPSVPGTLLSPEFIHCIPAHIKG